MLQKGYNNVVSSNGNSTAQKFGYNGKELNEELGLEWHDFGARNYDAALGRWMNLDPLAEQYANITPYAFVANMPIMAIDPDGKRIVIVGGDDYKKKVWNALLEMASTEKGLEIFKQMITSKDDVIIGGVVSKKSDPTKNAFLGTSKTKDGRKAYWVNINLETSSKDMEEDGFRNLTTSVTHELGHVKKTMDKTTNPGSYISEGIDGDKFADYDEYDNLHTENLVRSGLDYHLRETYAGIRILNMRISNQGVSTNYNLAFKLVPESKSMYFDYSSVNRASLNSFIKGVSPFLNGTYGKNTMNSLNNYKNKRFRFLNENQKATVLEKNN